LAWRGVAWQDKASIFIKIAVSMIYCRDDRKDLIYVDRHTECNTIRIREF
jgi:hypothetical protein